ncbi:MAG: ribbon-helix-helix domain-containing protein [Pseudomonadota bacterium]|nr:ribbon-helix-helix domain-containing protein [Pseudomonadota bacterium]
MPVEITRKFKQKKTRWVSAKVDPDVDEQIWLIIKRAGQTRSEFLQDAITDRLVYLQGYFDDKGTSDV